MPLQINGDDMDVYDFTKDILTVQEIVDLYIAGKFSKMTDQIDSYSSPEFHQSNPSDFWYELKEEFENCTTHEDDYSIFSEMVFEYHVIKEERKESEDTNRKLEMEESLIKFMTWILNDLFENEKTPKPESFVTDYLDSQGEKHENS